MTDSKIFKTNYVKIKKGVVKTLRTVNGGNIRTINNKEIEILSHNFHNPNCNIISNYFINEKGGKTELTYYKDIKTGKEGHEVYLFETKEELQHYKSYNYSINKLPQKYLKLAKELKNIHALINFEEHTKRERL